MVEYETFFSRERLTNLTYTGGALKVRENEVSAGFGIRSLENGKLGFAYCQSEKEIEKTKLAARLAAKFSPKTSFEFAPKIKHGIDEHPGRARSQNTQHKTPNIYDPRLDSNDLRMLQDYLEQVKDGAQTKGGKARVILGCSESYVQLENSNGFNENYKETGFSAYVETMDGNGSGYSYVSTNHRPKNLYDEGVKAAIIAKAMKNAKKPESGNYSVVMQSEAMGELIEILLPSLSGDWLRRKITKLKKGDKKFSEKLSIYDDGLALANGTRPFDDEGVPSDKRALIERGEVHSFFFDRETAALAKERTNGGFCSRSAYDSQPTIGHSNIVINPGNHKNLNDIGKHIEIHSAHGSHTANPTSGDFGLEVTIAFLVNGAKRTPIRGFMITGNIFDFFANIEGVENKQKTYGNMIVPRIAFKNVKIVA